jgi:hypothetical protein
VLFESISIPVASDSAYLPNPAQARIATRGDSWQNQ